MVVKFLFVLLYVAILGIWAPIRLRAAFPEMRRWKLSSLTFCLLFLSSFPGGLVSVAYVYGWETIAAASDTPVYLFGLIVGFGFLWPFPPLGWGWLAGVISIFTFFFLFRIEKNNASVEVRPSEELTSENLQDQPIQAGELHPLKPESTTITERPKAKRRTSRISTPIRRFVFVLLIPISAVYSLMSGIAVYEAYEEIPTPLYVLNEFTPIVIRVGCENEHPYQKHLERECIKRKTEQAIQRDGRIVTPSDIEWWSELGHQLHSVRFNIDMLDISLSGLQLLTIGFPLLLCWIFVYGGFAFVTNGISRLFVNLYRFIRFGT